MRNATYSAFATAFSGSPSANILQILNAVAGIDSTQHISEVRGFVDNSTLIISMLALNWEYNDEQLTPIENDAHL
jgi:hypothetical protein